MRRMVMFFMCIGFLIAPIGINGAVVRVDDFSAGDDWTLNSTGQKTDYGAEEHIIGGQRDTTFNVLAGSPTLKHIRWSSETGYMEYESGSSGQATWSLEYGRDQNLDHNMAEEGRVLFSVIVLSKNLPDVVHLTIQVISGRNTVNEASYSVEKDISGIYLFNPNNAPVEFPYSEFIGIDFSDMDYLKFTYICDVPSSPEGLELDIGRMNNCPEPMTLGILALGGLVYLRRRK